MITEQEFAELLADPTKEIVGDIRWTLAPGYRGSQRFTAAVGSTPDRGLRVYGWRKPASAALGYHVIHPSAGRVVGVCLRPGVVHHGPLCDSTGVSKLRCDCPRGVHKHRWTEQFGDEWVYVPPDITADAGDPSGGLAAVLCRDQPHASGYPARSGRGCEMVTKPALLDALIAEMRLEASDLFEFFPAPDGAVGVNTSLLYPDCDEVQVWILERDGEYVVTDYCDAHDWLRRARCFDELTAYQLSLIADVRRSLRLEGEEVELVARTTEIGQLPFLILNVALGAVRVADISYTCQVGGGS